MSNVLTYTCDDTIFSKNCTIEQKKNRFLFSICRSRDKDRSPKERNRDKESRDRRSKSRERRRRRSHSRDRRSKDRERSKRQERHHRDDDRQYEDERKRDREQDELREKEMERQRLREIAMELKAAQFSVLGDVHAPAPMPAPVPLMSLTVPMFMPEPPPKPEVSQAFLEAVAASQRIAASKNFAEIFNCTNSNDSASNGPTPMEEMNHAISNTATSKSFLVILLSSDKYFMVIFSTFDRRY